MPTTYTTPCLVSSLIRTQPFTACTTPTFTEVEEIINRQECTIDQRTGHTYGRCKTVTKEYQDMHLIYTFGWGTFASLKHREIRTCPSDDIALDPCAGDKLEIWNGSTNTFSDLTSTPGAYELIAERGEIYLRGFIFSILRKNRIRITYRYGSTTVPADIRDTATKMAAIDLINGSFRMDIIPMGADGAKILDTTKKWQEDIDRRIRNREEVFVIP